MEILVQKYGGTSMTRVKEVAKRVVLSKKSGHHVVVVVSAQAGMTDALISKSREVSASPCLRELDMMLATGEQVAISLLAMAIKALGEEAISYNSAQIKLVTDDRHSDARILSVDTDKIIKALESGKVVVLAGFQGVTATNEVTTLGRGGSDTSAIAIAAALNAKVVEIYTDVDGVYTADPRCVPDAKKIKKISYAEMLEMAGSGAKVLHLRSVEMAAKNRITVHLRSTFEMTEGTYVVDEEDKMETVLVRGVAHTIDQAKINIWGMKGNSTAVAELFEAISNAGIVVDVITQSDSSQGEKNVTFTIHNRDYKQALMVTKVIGKKFGAKAVDGESEVARVSVIGIGMKSAPGVAAKVFKSLSEEGIPIDMITTSNINISCIVPRSDYMRAIHAIHKAFNL